MVQVRRPMVRDWSGAGIGWSRLEARFKRTVLISPARRSRGEALDAAGEADHIGIVFIAMTKEVQEYQPTRAIVKITKQSQFWHCLGRGAGRRGRRASSTPRARRSMARAPAASC